MMFGIPKVYLILAALVAAIGIYFFGHHKGWVQRDMEMQVEIAKKNEESRAKEQALNQQINDTSSKLLEANNVLDKKSTDLDRAIRAGRVRFPSSSCVQAPTSSPSASPNSPETGSKSVGQADQTADDRATLAAIAEIVAQGDKNTAQLNACIDAYEAVRSQLNGK
jgi:type III secretory pathway component EscV